MTILNKKIATALSVLALLGLNACDTSTPAAPAEQAESTPEVQSFKDIKAPKDFAFSVYNEKGLKIQLSVDTDAGTQPYKYATVKIVAGGSKELLAKLLTDVSGEAHYDGKNLSASVESIGISIYAAGIPEDTLWYTKAELENLDRVILVNPTSFAPKSPVVAAKGKIKQEVAQTIVAPGITISHADHNALDLQLVNGSLFTEQGALEPKIGTPLFTDWTKSREFKITSSSDPLIKDSLWAHFMHTGAGYHNAFGYYWYKKSENPTGALSGIKRVTLFSLVDDFYTMPIHAPKALVGTVTKFKSLLANANDTIVIGYWLHANYDRGVNPSMPIWYTNTAYNVQAQGAAEAKHFVSFTAISDDQKVVLANEDVRLNSSDRDYNDLVVIVDVIGNNQQPPFIVCDTTTTTKKSRLGFEDKFPEYGDFDFNDLVVDLNVSVKTKQCKLMGVPIVDNTHGIENAPQMVSAKATVVPVANGAQYLIGFGASLGNLPGTVTVSNPASQVVISGTETIVEFFDLAKAEFAAPASALVNTIIGNPVYAPIGTYTATVAFAVGTPIAPITVNPFIYWKNDLSREIHLKGFPLTSRGIAQNPASYANPAVLGAASFSDINGLPWAIEIDQTTKYPVEFQDITGAYPQFASWATTGIPATWASFPVASKVY